MWATDHDGLTGLYNYTYFYKVLEREIAQLTWHSSLSAVMFDIDELKVVNDMYGHTVGDEVLKAFASTLKENFRATDTVSRYGGDEFAVIMPRTGKTEAEAVAMRFMGSISDQFVPLPNAAGRMRMPGAAWGCASYPEDGRTPSELIATAGRRMYKRKKNVRGRTAEWAASGRIL